MTTPMQSIDMVWILICAALVLLMQPGFICLEVGLVRAKNGIHVALKNILDLCLSGFIFWAVGFGLMFGTDHSGLIGSGAYFLTGYDSPSGLTFFIFQLAFCGTAVTIISGAVAERMRFTGYLVVTVITALALYPVIGHWVWGGAYSGSTTGWLAEIGFIDFAGATVVHSTGGWMALAAILVIGPRIGRFDTKVPIAGQNLPISALGVLLLWIGWLGFNGGSLLEASDRVPLLLVNTILAGITGGIASLVWSTIHYRMVRVEAVFTGVLAGLVGVTGAANVVGPISAALLGAGGALIALYGTNLLVRLKIDDVIGAVPVHVFAGIWGTLGVAIFGDLELIGTGLSRLEQLQVQALGVGVCALWGFGVGYVLLRIAGRFVKLRVAAEDEAIGLNIAEHGARTVAQELLADMELQRADGDFARPVRVDPHTEVGQIAHQYNRVLERVNAEAERAARMTEEAFSASRVAVDAQKNSEERVRELRGFNRLAVGRELQMVDLKKEVNTLLDRHGDAARYDLGFVETVIRPEPEVGGGATGPS